MSNIFYIKPSQERIDPSLLQDILDVFNGEKNGEVEELLKEYGIVYE